MRLLVTILGKRYDTYILCMKYLIKMKLLSFLHTHTQKKKKKKKKKKKYETVEWLCSYFASGGHFFFPSPRMRKLWPNGILVFK